MHLLLHLHAHTQRAGGPVILMSLLCTAVGMAAGAAIVHVITRALLEDETARANRLERTLITARRANGDDPTGRLVADIRDQAGRHRRGGRR